MTSLHATRLHPGDDLKQNIIEFVAAQRISAGVVVSGVGNLSAIVLRLADARPGHSPLLERSGPFEIVSLEGTVGPDDVHLHLSVAGHTGQVIGGHLKNGCIVGVTVELVILADISWHFTTAPDPQTGYDELVVQKIKAP